MQRNLLLHYKGYTIVDLMLYTIYTIHYNIHTSQKENATLETKSCYFLSFSPIRLGWVYYIFSALIF